MAITLGITGVLQAAAFWVSNKGGSNGWKLFTYFYIMLTVLGIVLGNDQAICTSNFYLATYLYLMGIYPSVWLGISCLNNEPTKFPSGTTFLVYYTRVNEVDRWLTDLRKPRLIYTNDS